MKVTTRALMSA